MLSWGLWGCGEGVIVFYESKIFVVFLHAVEDVQVIPSAVSRQSARPMQTDDVYALKVPLNNNPSGTPRERPLLLHNNHGVGGCW